MSKSSIIAELFNNQLKQMNPKFKLQYSDLQRIAKYINSSLFDKHKCCVWTGYITNKDNDAKGTYINFYFKKKKMALHRLLYLNFVGELDDTEYLKFNCEHRGECCNVNHMMKNFYNRMDEFLVKPIIKPIDNLLIDNPSDELMVEPLESPSPNHNPKK